MKPFSYSRSTSVQSAVAAVQQPAHVKFLGGGTNLVDLMREQIEHMTREAEFGVAGEHQEILETYKMFAYDEGWVRRINQAIDSGLTAEAAIERVQQRTRARMQEIEQNM